MELQILLKNQYAQTVKTLVDTQAEASLIYGYPKRFKGQTVIITELGGKQIEAAQTQIEMKIGNLQLQKSSVMIVPVPEYITGIDFLKNLTLELPDGQYQFGTKPYISMRPILVGKVKMPPVEIPPATKLVSLKQYCIRGGQKEIMLTIKNLLEAGVLKPITTSWNNLVWPVKKNDGSW